ncbi:MAG: hypothetical protein ACREI8_01075 [Myxococcota bacterium]
MTKRIWPERFEDIRNVEPYLARNGTVIRKFFLHVSNEWFTRLVVAAAVVDALAGLELRYPTIGAAQRKALSAARRELERE